MRADPEFKALGAGGGPKCGCGWLDEAGVLEDLFGERAHATIVSETAALLSLIELNEARGARAQADARRGVGASCESSAAIPRMLERRGRRGLRGRQHRDWMRGCECTRAREG